MFEKSSPDSAYSTIDPPPFPVDMPLLPMYHPEFYFEDGNLVILVENTLFRVFRSTFTRHSPVFKELFSLPEPGGFPSEGSEDENPLYLSGILSVDFARLLWILYPPTYGEHRAHTADEWTSILHLATRWEFTDIRALAIRELQSLSLNPIDKIALSREFDIQGRWTVDAYTALCERPDALTVPEASRLGLETATRIAQMRELLRARGRSPIARRTRPLSPRAGTPSAQARGLQENKPPRAQRPHWDTPRSFFDQENISPLAHTTSVGSLRRTTRKSPQGALPNTSRLVAEAFGLDMS